MTWPQSLRAVGWAIAFIWCLSADPALPQVISIPGAQISGAPLSGNITTWANPTTIQDSGLALSGLTVGVLSVGLTTSNTSIFGTGPTITSTGNLSFGLLSEAANTVLAGPVSGGSAVPTFRVLTNADLNFGSQTPNTFLGGPSAAPAAAATFRTLSNADLPNPSLSAIGGVRAIAKAANKWIDAISTSGVPNESQPSFSDISGTLSSAQIPFFTGSVQNTTGSNILTLTNGAVTNATMANMSGGTFKGTVITGAPQDLTASTILDTIGNTQGQLLFRSAVAWAALAAGTSGSALITQGPNHNPIWGSVGFNAVSLRSITATGTYTPSAGFRYGIYFITGGGGGGGAAAQNAGSGGGAAAGTAIGVFSAGTIGASQAVTIGAGGASLGAGNNSTFGALMTGNAGAAGAGATGGSVSGAGGTGGSASGGTVNITGGDGTGGGGSDNATFSGNGGAGGASFWGGGGKGAISNGATAGGAANACGSGGGGGANTGAGGTGATGCLFGIEFLLL